jgi:hypothetical protein
MRGSTSGHLMQVNAPSYRRAKSKRMSARPSAARACAALLTLAAISSPAAATDQTSKIKFAAFGDIGNTSNSAAVASLIRSQNVQFVLMLGDLCYGSTPIATQIGTNYAAEQSAGKLWPALGNHDFNDACGGGNSASGYRAFFTLPNNERYYDFKKGPVHFFVVNSYQDADGTSATSQQAMWLKGKLAASTSPWQVVYFHNPPYSSGDHGSSTYMRWPFEAWGADAVLSGHDHDYERLLIDGNGDGLKIPYIVSGLGGQSRKSFGTPIAGSVIRYSSAFGALIVTATSISMKFEFRDTGGTLIDGFTRTKVNTPQPTSAFQFRTVPKQRRHFRPEPRKSRQTPRDISRPPQLTCSLVEACPPTKE